jgi:para-nitrobenzyl esterase
VNVWTPSGEPPAAGRPVLVWFHGGALERGTPALPGYDGTTFARDGIVFVSVGHRVGAEGFSVLDGAPRNLGLSDAAAGLRWVQREIAEFGGDPDRITIFGESAGGALVAALLCRPDTAEIPSAAIIQSGPLAASSPEQAGRVTRPPSCSSLDWR